MDGDLSPVMGRSQGGKKRSCRHFVMEEPDPDFDGSTCERLYEVAKGLLNKKRQRPDSQDPEDELLCLCLPAEGSINQAGPGSVLEYWADQDDQHQADHPASPLPDSCSPLTSVSSAWDSLTLTPSSPGCWEQHHVDVAARLHLLGESMCLIGHHLQETTKMVRLSSAVSLLLDSLLCALPPLLGLTAEIPELRSCTQHSMASTLENISYVMPGM